MILSSMIWLFLVRLHILSYNSIMILVNSRDGIIEATNIKEIHTFSHINIYKLILLLFSCTPPNLLPSSSLILIII